MPERKIIINRYQADQINPFFSQLLALVSSGYQFSGTNLSEQTVREYQADVIYLTRKKGREIGSLSINIRPNDKNDPFWQFLCSQRPDLSDPKLLACYVQGVVVDPLMRLQGIAHQLLEKMINDFDPLVVLGQTKTPEAVLTRSKTLVRYGYRTFYGYCEVTPDFGCTIGTEEIDFIKAALTAEKMDLSEEGVYCVNPDIILPYYPATIDFSIQIQRAFKPIQELQLIVGTKQTAVTTLVSIKESVFSKQD